MGEGCRVICPPLDCDGTAGRIANPCASPSRTVRSGSPTGGFARYAGIVEVASPNVNDHPENAHVLLWAFGMIAQRWDRT